MGIRIIPHSAELSDAVDAFNGRMRAGGSHWGFYTVPVDSWLPQQEGYHVWREYHLAVDDDGLVRGAYALRPQQFWIRGALHTVTDWQGPFTEGAVSPRYAALGLRMVRDMLKKFPNLYSWGHGGNEQPLVQMLEKMKWQLHETPLCLRVLRPARFLRRNNMFRDTVQKRLGLDLLALSGAGSVGLRAMHAGLKLQSRSGGNGRATRGGGATQTTEEPYFHDWTDEVWERCRDQYSALSVRDAATMNLLIRAQGWPPARRLRVARDGQTLGWAAVLDTKMNDDSRFGTMRVGSIVDCLASPEDAGAVVAAATDYLRECEADIVISNQSHPGWVQGFADNGYLILQDKRLFAASPALTELLTPFDEASRGLHLTNMDGHGPMGL